MRVLIFSIYIITTVSGVLLTRAGALAKETQLSIEVLGIILNKYSLFGMICYGISFLLWTYLLQNNNLTWIIPLALGISNILTITGAVLLLKESIGLMQIVGIITIVMGLVILNLK
nr:hypothetical protein [uncultured Niameybacter sp.]